MPTSFHLHNVLIKCVLAIFMCSANTELLVWSQSLGMHLDWQLYRVHVCTVSIVNGITVPYSGNETCIILQHDGKLQCYTS